MMIDIARDNNAHAKFAGSSGAAVGLLNGTDPALLKQEYEREGFVFLVPEVISYD